MSEPSIASKPSRRRLLWGLFAWIGIPLLFVVLVPLASLLLRFDMGGVLAIAVVFAAAGTVAIVKGQRPARSWIVLLYPLPMVYFLVCIYALEILLLAYPGCC